MWEDRQEKAHQKRLKKLATLEQIKDTKEEIK